MLKKVINTTINTAFKLNKATQHKDFIITSVIAVILSLLVAFYTGSTEWVAPVYATVLLVGILLTKRNEALVKKWLPFLLLGLAVLYLGAFMGG